ncbi:uncharacterized protein PITG_15439 [Phytophthora infestans T30-4]|uniref:Uncharacterized protein n=1 Tax=Phytophthora infestans (strain T30-4) TaxID=403677 RepID=D0NR91_PHYIT|nr:uncharacterized protein PITG_15439 [Phytophthora infestans T30-4]EEY63213.1 hypothetical protein PITG_15439 [Phytophthora infestans T30-4]|eukprot:XP_002898390.1 hypothetical protein PITG_15439 [Phytophthora infestans T30-4]
MGSHDAMTKSLAQALPPQPAPTYLDIERLVHDTLRHDEAIKAVGPLEIKLGTDGENERDGSKQNGAESLKNRQVAEKSGFMQDQRIRGQPKCVETFWCRGIIDISAAMNASRTPSSQS